MWVLDRDGVYKREKPRTLTEALVEKRCLSIKRKYIIRRMARSQLWKQHKKLQAEIEANRELIEGLQEDLLQEWDDAETSESDGTFK